MSNCATATYKLLGWYIRTLRLFVICKNNGQVEEPNLVFVSFFLLTYPECFKDADCNFGTCTPKGECKCGEGLVKEGGICKRGENTYDFAFHSTKAPQNTAPFKSGKLWKFQWTNGDVSNILLTLIFSRGVIRKH